MFSINKRLLVSVIAATTLLAPACTTSTNEGASTTAALSPATTTNSVSQSTSSTAAMTTATAPPTSAAAQCSLGDSIIGSVTGVSEFVNLRTEPSVDAELAAEVPAGAEVVYDPNSLTNNDARLWLNVQYSEAGGTDKCGFVAAEYIKSSDGHVIGFVNAVSYVRRAMLNLEPEAAHATFTQIGPDSPEVPFDDAVLAPALAQLRQLALDHPKATVRVDPSIPLDPASNEPGCVFGDGLSCQVQIVDNEVVIATVGVAWYGDGISDVSVR